MNTCERSVHPSSVQVDCILDYMEGNPSLAKGFLRTASGRVHSRRKWERLSLQLNSMVGALKTWKQWAKYWSDKKSAVKKKGMLRSAARRRTGGCNEQVIELSDVEERIISLMGGICVCEGDRRLAKQTFHNEIDTHVSSPDTNNQNIKPPPGSQTDTIHSQIQDATSEDIQIIENENQLVNNAMEEPEQDIQIIKDESQLENNAMEESEQDIQIIKDESQLENNAMEKPEQVSSGPSQSLQFAVAEASDGSSTLNLLIFDSRSQLRFGTEMPQTPAVTQTEIVTASTRPASRLNSVQDAQTVQPPSPAQSLSQDHNTTPRRRRRTAMHTPSPSQHRTQLRSLAERFLRVEEQRLEIDRRNAQWSRERDQIMLNVITQMNENFNESLKLLAEAINKR